MILFAFIIAIVVVVILYKILNSPPVGLFLAFCFLIAVTICPVYFGLKTIIKDGNIRGGCVLIIIGLVFSLITYLGIKNEIDK